MLAKRIKVDKSDHTWYMSLFYYTLSLSPMNAGATIWRWWYQSSPLAINKPLPIKCFEPCCCSHDFPAFVLNFVSSSLIKSVSDKHILGSIPFQYINLLPTYIYIHICINQTVKRKKEKKKFLVRRIVVCVYVSTVLLGPSNVMRQEAADDVVVDVIIVFRSGLGD